MLLQFTIENFLSFQAKTVINLRSGTIKEFKESVFQPFQLPDTSILKSIAVFGHNASGKSNLIKAISFMRGFVLNSSKESQSVKGIPVQPFRLSSKTENQPSVFEVCFALDNTKYRYGFSATAKSVESEWLFSTVKKKEDMVFLRAQNNFSLDKKFRSDLKGKADLFQEMTRKNSLFLSVLSQFNTPMCLRISEWFSNILIAHDTDYLELINFTAQLLNMDDYRIWINDIIRKSEIGIESVDAEERISQIVAKGKYSTDFLYSIFKEVVKDYNVRTGHLKYKEGSDTAERVYFNLLDDESLGTQKFFGVLGPILYSIKNKSILWVDEIDARMHTHLVDSIINLFNSNKFNPNGAQLIFTSHNTNILKKGLRRDQMYFMEKSKEGASYTESLYSKNPKVRNDASFDKDYLLGKFGGVPNFGSQLNLFDSIQ